MPETEACEDAVSALERQRNRLDRILTDVRDGRWWPSDAIGHQDADEVKAHTKRIAESLDVIARIVADMKD